MEILDTTAPPYTDLDRSSAGVTDIPEEAAWQAYQQLKTPTQDLNAPLPTGDTLRNHLQQTLGTYVKQRREYGRTTFPQKTAQLNATRNNLLRDLHTKPFEETLTPDQLAQYNHRLQFVADKETYTARQANRALFTALAGHAIPSDQHDTFRIAYATRNLGMAPTDDLSEIAVFNKIRENHQQHAAFTNTLTGHLSTLAQSHFTQTIQAPDNATLLANIPKEHQTEALEHIALTRVETRRLKRKLTPIVETLSKALGTQQIKNQFDPVPGAGIIKGADELVAVINQLPTDPTELQLTLALLQEKTAGLGNLDKRAGYQRALENMTRGFRTALNGIATNIYADTPGMENIRAAKEKVTALEQILHQNTDLGKATDTFINRGIIDAANSTPYFLAATAGLPGLVTMSWSFAGQNMTRQLSEMPDGDRTAQINTSRISGVVEATTETLLTQVGLKAIAGKLPTITGILNKFDVRSKYARAAIGGTLATGATGIAEYTEEAIQDASQNLFADISAELSQIDNRTPTDWPAFFQEWAILGKGEPMSEQMRVLGAILPFALVAGGGTSFKHFRYGDALARNKTILRAIGVPETTIQEIATESDITVIDAKIQQAFEQGLEARTAEQRTEALAALREQAELYEAAGLPQIIHDKNDFTEETTYRVTNPLDQTTQSFETEEEALLAWRQNALDASETILDTITSNSVAEAIESLTDEATLSENTRVLENPNLLLTLPEAVKRGIVTQEQADARLRIFILQEGLSPQEATKKLDSIVIRARSFSQQTRDGSYKYTVELYRGAKPLDVYEDFAEDALKRALDDGLADGPTLVSQIHAYQTTTNDNLLDPKYTFDPDNTLPLVEAFSALARATAIGNVRSGTLPPNVAQWFETLAAYHANTVATATTAAQGFGTDFDRAAKLRQARDTGTLSPDLEAFLQDAIGINQEARAARYEEKHRQQALAELQETFPEVQERATGLLPHPETLRQKQHPLALEVQRLYNGLLRPTRRKNKQGKTIDRTHEANAFFLPPGEMADLDAVRRTLNEQGFYFDTPADLIEALDLSINYAKPQYGTQSLDEDSSFSLSPAINSQAFREWFAESKVTNPDGTPLAVYHGAPDVRGIINEGFKIMPGRKAAIFFTDSERVANTYADDSRAWDYQAAEPNIIRAYLSLQNPLIIEGNKSRWRETEKHIEEARQKGHDGLIIRNTRDEYNDTTGTGAVANVYVVFNPEQVRSAHTNPLRSRVDGIDLGTPSFSLSLLAKPLTSATDVQSLRHDKTAWTKDGATTAGARDIISKYYKTAAYASIPPDSILVPMPSTKGTNILPDALAERIAQDFGNPIEQRPVATATAQKEAKNKRSFFEKEADPVTFQPVPETITDLKGKSVVITEDVHNTGESWIAFAKMLIANDIDVVGIATLTSTEQRMTSPRDIERMAEKIAGHLNLQIADVKADITPLFHETFKQLFNKAEAEITRSAARARKLLDIAQSGNRSGAYQNPLADRHRRQESILEQSPQLEQSDFSFSLDTADTTAYFQDRHEGETLDQAVRETQDLFTWAAVNPVDQRPADLQRPPSQTDQTPDLEVEAARDLIDLANAAKKDPASPVTRAYAKEINKALAKQPGQSISLIIQKMISREIPHWNPLGQIVETPQDAFALNAAFRNPWFESVRLLAIDSNFKVISAEIHSVGTVDSAVVEPYRLSAFILRAQSIDPKAQLIISHNHPGGDPSPSSADIRLQSRLHQIADQTGITIADHVITNGTKGYSFTAMAPFTVTPDLDVNWTAYERTDSPTLNSPEITRALALSLRASNPSANYILYLDTRLRLRGINILPVENLQDAKRMILKDSSDMGAQNISLLLSTQTRNFRDLINNLNSFSALANIRLLDAIYTDAQSTQNSAREDGIVQDSSFSLAEEYGISHRPREDGPPAHNLAANDLIPADVYDHPEWYSGMSQKVIRETMRQLLAARGNPAAIIKIFRAGPKAEINDGDWVSLSKEYARTHAMGIDPNSETKVWQSEVLADTVLWSMDDLAEFGYFGKTIKGTDTQTSFSLSTNQLNRLEKLIADRLTAAPQERAAFYTRLRNRLAALTQQLEDMDAGIGPFARKATDDAGAEQRRILDAIAEARTIIDTLPVEARGRVRIDYADIMAQGTDKRRVNALHRLIDQADAALETTLQDSYLQAFERLLDLAAPDLRQNKTIRGRLTVETQRLVNQILPLVNLSQNEANAAQIAAEAQLQALQDNPPQDYHTDPEIAATHDNALAEAQATVDLIDTFAAIHTQSASELANAYQQLQTIYTKGRTARQILDQNLRQYHASARREVLDSLGGPVTQTQWAKKTEQDSTVKAKLEGGRIEHLSLHQLFEWIFPKSVTARQTQEALRAADRAFVRAKINARNRFEEFTSRSFNLTGTARSRKLNKILANLSKRRDDWNIKLQEGARWQTEKLSEEQAAAILEGTMKVGWETDPIALESLRQSLSDFRMQRATAQSQQKAFTKRVIRFDRIISRGSPAFLHMSDLEAVYVLQLAAQPQYLPTLDKYGFTEKNLNAIRDKINPQATALGTFLRSEYDLQYTRLNPVYQSLYGLDLPQIRNYAPGIFESQNTQTNLTEEGTTTVNSIASGFTKARSHHMARPQQINALNTYWSNLEQVEYFIAYAELSRDIRAIYRTPELRRTIEGRFGLNTAKTFSGFLDMMETDGKQRAITARKLSEMVNNLATSQSAIGLAFNVGTLLKQASAGTGQFMEMPITDAIKGTWRAITNPSSLRHIWNTETIQQRIINGINPEDKRLLDAANAKHSDMLDLIQIGRAPIAYADAAFTTITGASAYQHKYQEAVKLGLSDARAHEEALRFMDRIVTKTAQPATTQDKSMAELTATGFAKFLFLFRSDLRQKLANSLQAIALARRGDITKTDAARRLFFNWIIYGLLAEFATSIWRSIASDDDLEELWSVNDYLAAAAAGPISGMFLFGAVLENAVRGMTGARVFQNSANPIDKSGYFLTKGLATMRELEKEDSSLADMVKGIFQDTSSITQIIGAIDPKFTAIPSLLRIARDGAYAADNLGDLIFADSPNRITERIITEERANLAETRKTRAETITETTERIARLPQAQRQAALENIDPEIKATVAARLRRIDLSPTEKQLLALPLATRNPTIERIAAEAYDNPTERTRYLEALQNKGIYTPPKVATP